MQIWQLTTAGKTQPDTYQAVLKLFMWQSDTYQAVLKLLCGSFENPLLMVNSSLGSASSCFRARQVQSSMEGDKKLCKASFVAQPLGQVQPSMEGDKKLCKASIVAQPLGHAASTLAQSIGMD